jgi:hypothetical protein
LQRHRRYINTLEDTHKVVAVLRDELSESTGYFIFVDLPAAQALRISELE